MDDTTGMRCVSLMMSAAVALMQVSVAHGQTSRTLVDQGIADVDLLATSLRVVPPETRQPIGFERLYETPGRPDLLMRIDGGLTAVFPRGESIYAPTPFGVVPLIPAGAVFYIGRVDPGTLPGAGADATRAPVRSSLRLDGRLSSRLSLRLDGSVSGSVSSTGAAPDGSQSTERPFRSLLGVPLKDGRDAQSPHQAPSIWTNETYRRRRLAALLAEAARADRPAP